MHKLPVVLLCRSYQRLRRRANHHDALGRPASSRGAYRDRHGRRKRDAVGVRELQREQLRRRTTPLRTVKSRGPDTPTLVSHLRRHLWCRAGNGGQKARSTGENAKQPLKPSRREGRDISAEPVVLPRAFFLHADHGSGELPAFPAPSRYQGGQAHASLGRIAPRDRDALPPSSLSLNGQCAGRSRAAPPAACGYGRRWRSRRGRTKSGNRIALLRPR
jgi:hypothetical protein